jgi:iron-sulfur cluster insertion protein
MTAPRFREHVGESEISLTQTARQQLATLCEQVDDNEVEAVRIYVTGGGCSGMTYGMTFTDRRTPWDRVLQEEGFDIYVDAVAFGYLRGVEIDFVTRPTGSSFVFNNVFMATGGSGGCTGCGAAQA